MLKAADTDRSVFIHGIGHFHPENVIDNRFLEALDIETTDQWIMERVGIRSRRTVLPLDYICRTKNQDVREAFSSACYSNAETGKLAAGRALENAGLKAGNIGLVVSGGCSPDTSTPPEASRIAAALGIQALCFDMNAACSSFAAQIHWLSWMRREALPDFILLVSAENNTRHVNYSDRSSAVLWGDGTSAAVISTRIPARPRVVESTFGSDPFGCDKVWIPQAGHFRQQGSAVQSFAIKSMVQCYKAIASHYEGSSRRIFFIGHQANLKMLESVCERCQILPQRHLYNVDVYGNTGAAGAPSVLSQNWDKFQKNDVIAFIVVGAGLTWASLTIEWS